MQIDAIDARILAALQQDNRLTCDQLSAVAYLSPTAVQRRLKRLRATGVIEADVSIVSPKAVGRAISMLVSVTLERQRAETMDRFKRLIRAAPEIMSAYYVTGESDFVLIITARSMDEYEEFMRRLFYNNPDIKGVKTNVMMDRVKTGFTLPIEPTATESEAPLRSRARIGHLEPDHRT